MSLGWWDVEYEPGLLKRFWSKVDRSGGVSACHPWTGQTKRGYGYIKIGGKRVRAHRFAFGLEAAGALNVLHACDNTRCCNRLHLFLGTHADNVADMVRKGRNARGDRNGSRLHPERLARGDRHPSKTHPECVARGQRNGNAKLSRHDVREIRALRSSGMSQQDIAEIFGVHRSNIGYIVRGITWGHLS